MIHLRLLRLNMYKSTPAVQTKLQLMTKMMMMVRTNMITKMMTKMMMMVMTNMVPNSCKPSSPDADNPFPAQDNTFLSTLHFP